MIQLDPAAVEAAAKALTHADDMYEGFDTCSIAFPEDPAFWPGLKENEPGLFERAHKQANAAITAYLAAIEPQVRAAVSNFEANVEAYVLWSEGDDILERARDSSERDLFALLGMKGGGDQ